MNFRLSSLQQLENLKLRDKQKVVAIALSFLSPKQKVLFRTLKLSLLTPLFASLAIFKGWILLPILVVTGLLYPLLTTPIEIMFAKPHLKEALEEFKKGHGEP